MTTRHRKHSLASLVTLAIASAFAFAPVSQAQIFTDDAARQQARQNNTEIENIKSLVRELHASIVQLEKSNGQITILTQKNQALEEQVRTLKGRMEELQQEISVSSSEQNVQTTQQLIDQEALITNQQTKIDALEQRLLSTTAEIAALQKQVQDINMAMVETEDEIYAKAISAHQQNNLIEAIELFNQLLNIYPDGQFVVNSRYWLGQAHLKLEEYDAVLTQAQLLLDDHPQSERVPEAMLLMAQAHLKSGQTEQGQAQLQTLIAQYPTSLAADIARQQLTQ